MNPIIPKDPTLFREWFWYWKCLRKCLTKSALPNQIKLYRLAPTEKVTRKSNQYIISVNGKLASASAYECSSGNCGLDYNTVNNFAKTKQNSP